MVEIDLVLAELAYLRTWANKIAATLDGWGLTEGAVASVKELPATAAEINSLTADFKQMRERVNYFLNHLPPITTPEHRYDVMRVDSAGNWVQYRIPTQPEV